MAEIPVTYNGFKGGMDNVQPEYALRPSVLRDAVNVDLFDDGNLRRRRGFARLLRATRCHSLFSDGTTTLFAAANTLKRLNSDWTTVDLAPVNGPLAYLALNGDIYWSDGTTGGRVSGGVNQPWGVENPNGQPQLAALPTGGLHPGTYQVAVTYLNGNGEESGTGMAAAVEVAAGGGIQLANIPQPLAATVQQLRMYWSDANGSVLYAAANVPVGTLNWTLNAASSRGSDLKTQFLDNVPGATALAYHKGRLYLAAGSVLWYTEPLRYGLTNRSANFIPFARDIQIVAAVPDGLYVATDRTYFLSSPATEQMEQVEVLPYAGVPGTKVDLPTEEKAVWFTAHGPVLAGAGGQVTAPASATLAAGPGPRGAAFYREQDSLKQYVALVSPPGASPLAAHSYMDAEVIRQEHL